MSEATGNVAEHNAGSIASEATGKLPDVSEASKLLVAFEFVNAAGTVFIQKFSRTKEL